MSCYGLNIDREKHPIHSDDDSVWISFIFYKYLENIISIHNLVVMGVIQWTLVTGNLITLSLISYWILSAKRAPVISIFIDGLPLYSEAKIELWNRTNIF